jgi:hypothetical protein
MLRRVGFAVLLIYGDPWWFGARLRRRNEERPAHEASCNWLVGADELDETSGGMDHG